MGFGMDSVLREEDLEKLEPEIAFVTRNTDIETVALVSSDGYKITFAAVPGYATDPDALAGLASALPTTAKLAMSGIMNEHLNETIV